MCLSDLGRQVCSHIPMGRPGSSEEIAAVFAFLASEDASYITGQTLYACTCALAGATLLSEIWVGRWWTHTLP